MKTRFCPTLRYNKFLHLGHACALVLTRRWAFDHQADFFHLFAFLYDLPDDHDDALAQARCGAVRKAQFFQNQFKDDIVKQMELLLQWVPAPVCSTLLTPRGKPSRNGYSSAPTQWCDEVMGTTDIFRGGDAVGCYTPHHSVTLHELPLLVHPDLGIISNQAHCGRFRLDHLVRYFNSQWHLLNTIIAFTWHAYEVKDMTEMPKVGTAIYSEKVWEQMRQNGSVHSDRYLKEASYRWLGLL